MANHTSKLQPTPVLGATAHPGVQAPAGTRLYTEASCNDGNGGMVVFYPIDANPITNPAKANGQAARTGLVARYVPAKVAARDLAWWPTAPAPRAATQVEADSFFSSARNRNAQDPRSTAQFAQGDEALVVRPS